MLAFFFEIYKRNDQIVITFWVQLRIRQYSLMWYSFWKERNERKCRLRRKTETEKRYLYSTFEEYILSSKFIQLTISWTPINTYSSIPVLAGGYWVFHFCDLLLPNVSVLSEHLSYIKCIKAHEIRYGKSFPILLLKL